MNELSGGLKDAKFEIDKAGLDIKPIKDLQHHHRYEEEDKETEPDTPTITKPSQIQVISLGKIDKNKTLKESLLPENDRAVDQNKVGEMIKQLKNINLSV